jgi:hypothetical protein
MFCKLVFSTSILLIMSLSIISAQDLKRVTKNPFQNFVEQYFVLKDNPKIKEGPVILKINGIVSQEGFYKDNQRAGLWKIFKSKNVLEFTYNYDNKQIVFYDKQYFPNPSDSSSHIPVYLGGLSYFLNIIANSVILSDEDRNEMKSNHDYYTLIGIQVDSTGIPLNFEVILASNNPRIDQRAVDAVKKATSYFPFLPALEKGKPVRSVLMAPVHISIH